MTKKYDLEGKRVFVAGHKGMVGSALVRHLVKNNVEVVTAGREQVDLCSQDQVSDWFDRERPDAVLLAAAKVGGIHANNSFPVDFLLDNLRIETNVIDAAYEIGVEKLLFLGSSCIYPKFANQPIHETELLTGALEPTNEWYAIAKIAGLKLCQAYRRQHGADFITAMPTNLYGPGDNFDLEKSHVVPALIRKAHDAKKQGDEAMIVWGSGSPKREFMHVDDAAEAMIHLMENYSDEAPVNVGVGEDVSILELTDLVCKTVGYEGRIETDLSKPDGTPRKLLDVSRLFETGWRPKYSLPDGLKQTYSWFLDNADSTEIRL